MLVVDIFDDQDSMRNREATSDFSRGSDLETDALVLPVRAGTGASTISPRFLDGPRESLASMDPVRAAREAAANGADLDEARNELIKQFGRAASQGLLTPRIQISNPRTERASLDKIEDPPKTDEDEMNEVTPDQGQQIRARSSMDTAFADLMNERIAALTEANSCLAPALTDVDSWASKAPIWRQVSEKRAALTGEFDRMNDDAVIALARLYVHFGFGLEAKQVLGQLSSETLARRVLIAMADIMDQEHADTGSPLHDQFDCGGDTALWSTLSHEVLPSDQRLDTDEIIQAFSGLPKHLRGHLGPILSRRLLEGGLTEASEAILRILNRTPETTTSRSELIVAQTERAAGKDEEAEARLEKIAKSGSGDAAHALVQMIESLVRRKEAVSYDVAQLAAAYAFENRGGQGARALHRAHVLALAASGAFDEAYTVLDSLEAAQADSLRPTVSEILTRAAPEMTFLKHVLSGRAEPFADMAQSATLDMAKRLFEAGFTEVAAKAVEAHATYADNRDARILRARISLAEGLPRQAEVDLLGLDGRDVNVLRAKARSLAGEHGQAHDLFRSAGLDADAEREAWLADNPGIARDRPEPAVPVPELARKKALLDESNATRAQLRSLLAKNPMPVVEN